MYKVIKFFTDLQDDGHAYTVGDTYPREGLNPSQKRIKELVGTSNRQGKALIKEVPEANSEASKDETLTNSQVEAENANMEASEASEEASKKSTKQKRGK